MNRTLVNFEDTKAIWTNAGQGQVFAGESGLSEEEREALYLDLSKFDPNYVNEVYELATKPKDASDDATEPVETAMSTNASSEQRNKWRESGMTAIRDGKVAVILFAGGQGTRLGSKDPKGMFDVGLPSRKSLFQIQAEKLRRLAELCGKNGKAVSIPWYIMTSSLVHSETVQFFKHHSFFGLNECDVKFFQQDDFPVVDPEGKVQLGSKTEVAKAPNGNGGVWKKLADLGMIDDMKRDGVEWIATYCVDNILVTVADPLFLGFCIDEKLDIGAKVVGKSYPEEKVGVLAKKGNGHTVLEYSEIDEERRNLRDETGKLVYGASHLVINNYHIDFLKKFCDVHLKEIPYHIARKEGKVLDVDGTLKKKNIWKMELFAFDALQYTHNVKAFETLRNEEFSPLKNSLDADRDNAKTCREDSSNLHRKWLLDAGAVLVGDGTTLCEVSPLLSYTGEGLDALAGKKLQLPLNLENLRGQ